MSAIGAVTGQGVYAELEYKGRRFKLSQWTNEAMDAVSTAAFLHAARMTQIIGGNERALANREVALARSFALGGFSFDTIVQDEGMENNPELLATFLHRLLLPNDSTVKYELALEICKESKQEVIKACRSANPLNGKQETKSGQASPEGPASVENGNASATPASPSS